MKKIILMLLCIWGLVACKSGPHFEVSGTVSDAKGKMLYLESAGLDGVVALDSVKLGSDGEYEFKQPRPQSPEFYRLRIEDRIINFAIDSVETIGIDAPYNNFATKYSVSGSENNTKIRELVLKQFKLQNSLTALVEQMRKGKLPTDKVNEEGENLIAQYKNDVKLHYIYAAPNKAFAYFALFQQVNNVMIFDPLTNKEDVKCFAAVATSLNLNFPNADRTKNLCNMVIRGMRNTRKPVQRQMYVPNSKITEAGLIDVSLADVNGTVHSLSSLKGKVVLLDFTIMQAKESPQHNLMLRSLYNKFAKRGFQIYQVSLDDNEHFWKVSADKLPWICVHDPEGSASSVAASYNVQAVPSLFLINRNNELKARGETIKNLGAAIQAML